MPPPNAPNYGIDAPPVVGAFLLLTITFTLLGVFIGSGAHSLVAAIGPWVVALGFGTVASRMISSSRKGKLRLWAEVLDQLGLAGDEQVLDVGCGRGLVLVEAARRVPQGHVTGIDLWQGKDQSGNDPAVTKVNAKIAGVADRVEVRTADMTDLPFADERFDVVTASLAIHNVPDADARATAVREITRVLRPGGRAVIVDIAKTDEYLGVLRDQGLEILEHTGRRFATTPPSRVIVARRPPSPTLPG